MQVLSAICRPFRTGFAPTRYRDRAPIGDRLVTIPLRLGAHVSPAWRRSHTGIGHEPWRSGRCRLTIQGRQGVPIAYRHWRAIGIRDAAMRAAAGSPERPLRPLVGAQEAFWGAGHVRSRVAAIGVHTQGGVRVARSAPMPVSRGRPSRALFNASAGRHRAGVLCGRTALARPPAIGPAWSRYGVGGCARNALPIAKWPRVFGSAPPDGAAFAMPRWLLAAVDAGRGGAAASQDVADAGRGGAGGPKTWPIPVWGGRKAGMGWAPQPDRTVGKPVWDGREAGMRWAPRPDHTVGKPVHDGHPCRYAMGARRIVALVRRRAGGTVWRGRMPVADGRPVRPGGGSGRRWAGGARSSHSGCGGGSRQAFRK